MPGWQAVLLSGPIAPIAVADIDHTGRKSSERSEIAVDMQYANPHKGDRIANSGPEPGLTLIHK